MLVGVAVPLPTSPMLTPPPLRRVLILERELMELALLALALETDCARIGGTRCLGAAFGELVSWREYGRCCWLLVGPVVVSPFAKTLVMGLTIFLGCFLGLRRRRRLAVIMRPVTVTEKAAASITLVLLVSGILFLFL